MRARLLILCSFLLANQVHAGNLSLESGFINSNLKGKYKRQTGYERWKGKRSGFIYRLNYNDTIRVNGKAYFRLGIISGNTKNRFLRLGGNPPFNHSSKTFDIEELSLSLRDFPFNGLSMDFGKIPFNAPPLISDYLWGGRFTYKLNNNLSIQWNQIQGYEGRYLLFNTRAEDDIDVFGPEIRYRQLSLGFLRISDARGKRPGKNLNNLFLSLKDKNLNIYGLLQNGKVAGCLKYRFRNFSILSGYSQKGITSYGFREFNRDIGYVYKPTFSDVLFVKPELSFNMGNLSLNPSYLYLQRANGGKIGDEIGMDVSYLFLNGRIFLNTSRGTNGSYVFYTGYRFNVGKEKFPYIPKKYNQKFYFNVWGEYLNPPKVYYKPQNGYEGWENAEHIGFWHSTFKYSLESDRLRLKVSTGRNSKVDYVVFGNTVDNMRYQRKHGKLWHFESLNYGINNFTLGLQNVNLNGFINENLIGTSFSNRFRIGYFLEQNSNVEKGSSNVNYIITGMDYKGLGFNYVYRTNKSEFNQIYNAYYRSKPLKCSYTREYGSNLNNAWGLSLNLSRKLKGFNFDVLDAIFSKRFTTFGLRESIRNLGFIYRPTEGNLRTLRFSISRNIPIRFNPTLSLSYLKLRRFNGSLIGDEGDAILSFKPFKKSKLSFIYALANRGSDYKGLAFTIRW